MGFKENIVSCEQGDSLLQHKDALIALQTAVDSKKVRKTFTHSDFEEMVGEDLSISLVNCGDKIKGIMFNLKKGNVIDESHLNKIRGLNGIVRVDEDSYTVSNEANNGYEQIRCVEVVFDKSYPTTAYNMRRIAGIIDLTLGTYECQN